MNYLIQNAWAQDAGPGDAGFAGFLPLIILFVEDGPSPGQG